MASVPRMITGVADSEGAHHDLVHKEEIFAEALWEQPGWSPVRFSQAELFAGD